ncbi:cytochrome b-245 chaperone 1 homolog [Diadema antillarum]|uniref:cytochrome b-245 chaperone 1 homolog n=1 Tax=Diadema antillarum TaxID=105358 RepID=UPI003A8A8CCC
MPYMSVVSQDDKMLHLSRVPGLRAWSTSIGILAVGVGMVVFSTDDWLWKTFCLCCCMFVATCALDDWEECFIEKEGEIHLKRFSLIEKLLRPRESQREVVVDAKSVIKADVEMEDIRFFGRGHVVMLHFSLGYSMPLTEKCTLGDGSDHQKIADVIHHFLDLDQKVFTHMEFRGGNEQPSASSSSSSSSSDDEGGEKEKTR